MLRKLVFAVACLSSTSAFAAPARQFLSDAIKGDNSEITLGRLIAVRGAGAEVRAFGNTLVRDHNMARTQVATLARSMGMAPPRAIMPDARSELRKLERLHGRAFDREVRSYMIDDHHKDIAKFQSQVRSGDRRTASLARAQLPTLRKHLRIAEAIRP